MGAGVITFTVFGVAAPKGSHRARIIRTKTGAMLPIVTESNRNVSSWQQLIAAGAGAALSARADTWQVLTEGVRLTVVFFLPRPKKYQRRGVVVAHLTKPDLSKLLRAVEDALTSIIWRDDCQVIDVVAMKRYAAVDEAPRVVIRVEPAAASVTMPEPRDFPLFEAV